MKKLTSVFLVLMLVLALLPVGVLAQDGEVGTVAEESDTTLTTPVDTTEVKTEGEGEVEETPKTEDEPKVEENKVEEELKTEDENKTEEEPKTEEVQLEGDGTEGEGNGTEGEVDEKTYVAAIDEEQYETLAAAIEAVQSGETIKLLTNITLEARVDVNASGKTITIDLDNHQMSSTATCANGSVFNVESGNVTIQNGTMVGIEGDAGQAAPYDKECDVITVRSDAVATLKNLNITVNSITGACVYAFTGSRINIESGNYTNSATETGPDNEHAMLVNQNNVATQLIFISGGTFNGKNPAEGDNNASGPRTFLYSDDYESTGADGTWTVSKKPTVATIGEDEYTSLQKAVNEATGTDTATEITLERDTTEDVVVPANKNIKLNLNNHKITNKSSHTITVANGATLEITGTGTVDNITNDKGAIFNEGTVTLSGGTYERSKEAGASKTSDGGNSWYTIKNVGTMTIYAGVTVKNSGGYSSMITNGYYKGSTKDGTNGIANPNLTINGGTFDGGLNTVKNDDFGTLLIIDGEFKNTAQACIQNHNTATIKGGTYTPKVAGVEAVINCGVCGETYTGGAHTLTIEGGTFNGGISKTLGTITITGGTFSADPNAYVTANDKAAVKSGNVWVVKTDNATETDEATGTTTATRVTKTNDKTTVTETTQTKDATGEKTTSTTVIKTEITADATTVTKIANITENNVATTTTVADNKATVKAEMQQGGAGSTVNTGVRTLKLDATTAAEQGSARKTEVTIASDATKLLKQDAEDSKIGFVEIKTDVATVTINNAAVKTMTATGSGTTSATLKLVVEETNAPSAVQDAKAAYALDAYLNDVPVFKAEGAGTNDAVVISVPYTKTNSNSQIEVYYVSADGKTQEKMVAEYEDGVLTWETNHFSTFVVVEKANAAKDDAAKPADAKKPPRTGDESNLTLWLALALLATCATVTTTVVAKKKNYNK